MTKLEERYKAWTDAESQALIKGDVDALVSLWAQDCRHTAIDAFGEHHTIQGREAIRKAAEGWVNDLSNPRLLKNVLLSASDEKGIGNAEVRWTGSDGKEWACNYIYMISLDEQDRCVSYTEWNVVKSREA